MAHHHDEYAQMPQILREIAEVAGKEAANILALAFGGRKLYIPGQIKRAKWLEDIVGAEASAKLIDHFTFGGRGVTYQIPMGSRAQKQKMLAALLEQGLSVPDAAKKAGVHMRTAYRLRRRLSRDDRQIDIEDYLAGH